MIPSQVQIELVLELLLDCASLVAALVCAPQVVSLAFSVPRRQPGHSKVIGLSLLLGARNSGWKQVAQGMTPRTKLVRQQREFL